MSNDAVKEIQRSLNIIRSTTDKEEYSTKVKVLELMTQAVLSHIQALEPISLVKNKNKSKGMKMKKPSALPIPKSLNTPTSSNNVSPTLPTSNAVSSSSISSNDINNMKNDFISKQQSVKPIQPQQPL
jgi:predicted transcriptional regulator